MSNSMIFLSFCRFFFLFRVLKKSVGEYFNKHMYISVYCAGYEYVS